jgi:FkbM family methyltransferase
LSPNSFAFRALEFYGTRVRHRGKWRVHSRLRKLLRADCDAELQVTRDGLEWLLNPSDYAQSEFFWLGAYEYWERYHFGRLLRPGDVVFDIGANFGYYSIAACAVLKGNCLVHAFEPNPALYARLVKNVELNDFAGRIRAYATALSDTCGLGHLNIKPSHSGIAKLVQSSGGATVSLTTLDDFCRANGIEKVDFLKIDVEGLEERVLRGTERTMSSLRPLLLIELHPTALAEEHSSVQAVAALLQKHGYDIYTARRHKLLALRELPTAPHPVKVFCFPKGRTQVCSQDA